MDWYLVHELYFHPSQLDKLTLSEIGVLLEDLSKPKPPGAGRPMGANEVAEYVKEFKSLTLREKIRRARAGQL